MLQDINFTPIFEYIDAKNDELLEKMQGIFATKEDVRCINDRLAQISFFI